MAEVLLEWAGAQWEEATVDDLQHAQYRQKLYLDALERERAQRLAAAGIADLTTWRKGRP